MVFLSLAAIIDVIVSVNTYHKYNHKRMRQELGKNGDKTAR
jgi:hypothetical protein